MWVKYSSLPMKKTGFPPNAVMMPLMKPLSGERKQMSMPQNTTLDTKCGRKVRVCAVFLSTLLWIYLNMMASRIGAGKPATML